jgi:hypothetical protein
MKTAKFLVGAAAGYVLGTRAGRERYRQIVAGARRFGRQPAVQQVQTKVKDIVDQGTAVATDKIGTMADKVTAKMPPVTKRTDPVTVPLGADATTTSL